MRMSSIAIGMMLAAYAAPALANTPPELVDLVGSRAPGAEQEMQARGWVDVGGNNTWWSEASGTCVKVHVSQGNYSRIDRVTHSVCGKSSGSTAGVCPVDVSQADRYKYPACN